MSNGNGGIKIVAVINPCLYGVVFSGFNGQSFAGVYGIVPPELKVASNASTGQLAAILDHWRSYNSNVKELISSSDRIEFVQTCVVDGIPFGEFTLIELSGQKTNLKDYLLQTTIGVASNEPLKDALIIKNNSLKPGDFNPAVSLSSSDESSSPSIKERRKSRSRATGLKKPVPLPQGKVIETPKFRAAREFRISHEDSNVVNAILTNQSFPSEFCHRFSLAPQPDIFSSPPVVSKTVEKKPTPAKELNLETTFCYGEAEIGDDFHQRKKDWIETIAAKHSLVKIDKSVEKNPEKMSAVQSPSPPRATGRGRLLEQLAASGRSLPMGRGQFLRTIMERDSPTPPPSGLGRGVYLHSAVSNTPKNVGRGQWYRQMLEESQSTLNAAPKPGALRRVFSMDTVAGVPRATTTVGEDSSDSPDTTSIICRNNDEISNDISSATSSDSLNQSSNDNQAPSSSTASQPEDIQASASDPDVGSNCRLKLNKTDMFVPEEIPSQCPVNEYLARLVAFGGLIHGRNPEPPVTNLRDMNLHPLIVESLSYHKVKDLDRCQSYAIPAILKRRNVVVIGPPRSGKTLAAVIPLLSLLCERDYYSSLKPGCGPRAVYITSYAQSVLQAKKFMSLIAPHLTVVSTYGGGLELEKKEQLVNGCDILISTPRCWLRLLTYKWVTSLNRLCHLFIDDLDTIINLFFPEMVQILKIIDGIKEKQDGPELQVVLIGESWTPPVNSIVLTKLETPLLSMTSHLEAALYANIKPKVHILHPDNKIDKLCELLKDKQELPSIIMCSTHDEVIRLKNYLYTRRTKLICAHGKMILPMLRDAHVDWQNLVKSKVAPPLMIVDDDVLCDMGINNAQWLCHYSLPVSKTSFSYRFSSIKSYFADRLINPQASVPDCKVDVLVDYTNEQQLPDVISFMSRLKTQIPEELLSASEKITKEKELSKSSEVGLCNSLVQFGRCWREARCKQQHCINYSRDKPRNLPLSGYVKLKVLHVHSATHFSVRLLAHTEDPKNTSSWSEIQSSYTMLALHLNRYFADRCNRRSHGTAQIGDLAAIEIDADINYKRVKVLQITSYDERRNPRRVKVHLIDEGAVSELESLKLLHLPNELRTYPRSSIDMYLTGLLPVDLDKDWSFATTSLISKKIKSVSDEYSFVAKVALVVGYTMLVDSLKAIKSLEFSKCNIVHFSLKSHLIESKLAVLNPDHLTPLIRICQEASLPVSATLPQDLNAKQIKKASAHKKVAINALSHVTWAHLPADEISSVVLTNADSPSLLYVSHVKFSHLLATLEKDMANYMENNPKRIDVSEAIPHLICLAKYEDRWNRGMLCEEQPETAGEEDELKYPVRFVDYGDVTYLPITDIALCPDKFISTLPFQAIKCELVGLNPVSGEWPDEAIDTLYEITQTRDSDDTTVFKHLSLMVTGTATEEPSKYSGKHYKVILIDSSSGKDVILNKEIVYRGFANWNPSEKHLLDVNIASFQPNSTVNDDEKSVDESTFGEEKSQDDGTSDAASSIDSQGSGTDSDHSAVDFDQDGLIDMLEKFDIQLTDSADSPLNFFANLQKNVLNLAGKKTKQIGMVKKAVSHTNRPATVPAESENDADISEMEDTRNSYPALAEYHLKSGFFTPRTAWLQTNSYVYIRIMIPSIEKYSLVWSSGHFDFSATYDGKRYRLYTDLFGPINPDKLTHAARGQYVEMKMLKTLTDTKWPRLLYDEKEKPIWLQILNEPDLKDDNLIGTQVDFGEISSKHCKKKVIKNDGELWHYDHEDEESDNSDVGGEPAHQDPYDPLH